MSHIIQSSCLAILGLGLFSSEAVAQYYNPNASTPAYAHQSVGGGLDLGIRNNGINPNVGLGVGQVGAGLATGLGQNGVGQGLNVGVGPLGVSADAGLSRNGLGVRTSAGIGNTGAALEGGISDGGVGLGASTKILGFGGGASLGVGDAGPGLGASLAFGPLGTLVIGSHRNSYPGAEQTAAYTYPNQNAAYYTPQHYGQAPYYQPAPVQRANYQQLRPQPQRVMYVQQPQGYSQARAVVQPAYTKPVNYHYQSNASACPPRWVC